MTRAFLWSCRLPALSVVAGVALSALCQAALVSEPEADRRSAPGAERLSVCLLPGSWSPLRGCAKA